MGDWYHDEADPPAPFLADSEAGRVVGLSAAIDAPALAHESGVLPGYFTPAAAKVGYGEEVAAARPLAYFEHQPPVKYADETLDPLLSFAPTPSIENQIAGMNGSAYNPYLTKEPKERVSDRPTTQQIVQSYAELPGEPLASSETAMLQLLTEF